MKGVDYQILRVSDKKIKLYRKAYNSIFDITYTKHVATLRYNYFEGRWRVYFPLFGIRGLLAEDVKMLHGLTSGEERGGR